MSSELHPSASIPKIEIYIYKSVLFRIAVLAECTLWNVKLHDGMYAGCNFTVIAAKNRAKLEIDRAGKATVQDRNCHGQGSAI